MTAALLAELHAVGVTVSADADLAAALAAIKTRIVDVCTVPPEAFDRPLYDRLWRLLMELAGEEESS